MTEENFLKVQTNRSRFKALGQLLVDLAESRDLPHALRFGYEKDYLHDVLENAIGLEISKLELEFREM